MASQYKAMCVRCLTEGHYVCAVTECETQELLDIKSDVLPLNHSYWDNITCIIET